MRNVDSEERVEHSTEPEQASEGKERGLKRENQRVERSLRIAGANMKPTSDCECRTELAKINCKSRMRPAKYGCWCRTWPLNSECECKMRLFKQQMAVSKGAHKDRLQTRRSLVTDEYQK